MGNSMNIGIMGTGNIAPRYAQYTSRFDNINVVSCADLDTARAKQFASEHNLRAQTVDEMLADPDLDIIVNLTIPRAHKTVSLSILEAGKHVYSEKPLGLSAAESAEILAVAQANGLRVGCAPDTFLGGGLQTCRKLIDEGQIGRPVAAVAFMGYRGPEQWHPNPGFFYETGGGPVLDMGPYYITALVNLLGPAKRVTASAQKSFTERTAGHESIRGEKLPVEVSTHVAGTIDFASGAVATVIFTFDVWAHQMPHIEMYGTDGSLNVPDPNHFGGEVKLWQPETQQWCEAAHTHYAEIERGIGIAEMAAAIAEDRPHRASGALAHHVLEIMLAFDQSSTQGEHIIIESQPERPDALPVGWTKRHLGLSDA